MVSIRKIVAPTDFSRLSREGVLYALSLAKAIGAEVTVCYVVGYGELVRHHQKVSQASGGYRTMPLIHPLDRFQRALDRFLTANFAPLLSELRVLQKVMVGPAGKSIVKLAKQDGADLIILSTHGRTGLSHALFGSVTEKIVRQSPCPVLSLHPVRETMAPDRVSAVA